VSDDDTHTGTLDAVVLISGALAAGSTLLAIGHAGIRIPVVSALGPGGSRAVVPAAIAFSVAACLHGAVAAGVARRRAWAWPLGILVAAVTMVAAAVPFRGAGSVVGITLAGTELVLLLTGRARRAILHPAA
jgi:hypothetical protein